MKVAVAVHGEDRAIWRTDDVDALVDRQVESASCCEDQLVAAEHVDVRAADMHRPTKAEHRGHGSMIDPPATHAFARVPGEGQGVGYVL